MRDGIHPHGLGTAKLVANFKRVLNPILGMGEYPPSRTEGLRNDEHQEYQQTDNDRWTSRRQGQSETRQQLNKARWSQEENRQKGYRRRLESGDEYDRPWQSNSRYPMKDHQIENDKHNETRWVDTRSPLAERKQSNYRDPMKDYQMEYDIPNEMRWDDTRRSPPRERRGPNYRSDPSYRRQSEESWEAESRRQPLRRGTRHGNYPRDSICPWSIEMLTKGITTEMTMEPGNTVLEIKR